MTPGVVARYRALGLAMDRHVPGPVDSYYGPKQIPAGVGGRRSWRLSTLWARHGQFLPPSTQLSRSATRRRRLEEVVPGDGPLLDRYVSWRGARTVPVDRLQAAVASLAS